MGPRNHPGGPWEQQDGLEVVIYRILFDFKVILGPVYISFSISRSLTFDLFFGLVSMLFLSSIYESKFRRLGLPNRSFCKESLAKLDFSRKSFLMNFLDRFLSFFGGLGGRFSGFLGLENGLEIRGIFGDVTNVRFGP